MQYIINKLIDGLLWIWSHSPIFCLSDDINFATLNHNNFIRNKIYRFSLINIMLGGHIFYIGTFKIYIASCYIKKLYFLKTDSLYFPNFTLSDITRLGEIFQIKSHDVSHHSIFSEYVQAKAQKATQKFQKHINWLSSGSLQVEKEKLIYHIEQQNRRLDISLNKVNAYTTVILAIIPIVTATIQNPSFDIIQKFVLGIDIYILLNICIFIFEIIKINAYYQSSFADLKKAPDKEREIVIQYYYDWQNLKSTADFIIGHVGNLQQWIIIAIPILGCTYLLLT